jgi:hypothetical protein
MAEHLENLALRLENDPFFLSCPLRLFAKSAGLGAPQLAERLGCSLETLVLVRLCRSPREEPGQFQKDIARIAATYHVDAGLLTDAVRRGQAIWHLHHNQAGGAGTLLAARDGEADPEEDR